MVAFLVRIPLGPRAISDGHISGLASHLMSHESISFMKIKTATFETWQQENRRGPQVSQKATDRAGITSPGSPPLSWRSSRRLITSRDT